MKKVLRHAQESLDRDVTSPDSDLNRVICLCNLQPKVEWDQVEATISFVFFPAQIPNAGVRIRTSLLSGRIALFILMY